MQNRRPIPCPAQQMAAPMAGLMVGLASGIASAHMNGIAAMRAAREASASQQFSVQLELAMHAAHAWADCAKEMAAEIERLKGENAKLDLLARQHYGAAQRLRKGA